MEKPCKFTYCLVPLTSEKLLTRLFDVDLKLRGYAIWMTMVSTVTLWSVEFLDMVGGGLEVPPDEYFEVEYEAS